MWRTAELDIWVICNYFYDSRIALISLMEKLGFGFTWGFCCWLGLLVSIFMNQILKFFYFQLRVQTAYCVFTVFSAEDLGRE